MGGNLTMFKVGDGHPHPSTFKGVHVSMVRLKSVDIFIVTSRWLFSSCVWWHFQSAIHNYWREHSQETTPWVLLLVWLKGHVSIYCVDIDSFPISSGVLWLAALKVPAAAAQNL